MAMKENNECSKCTEWGVQAVETKDVDSFELLNVADWSPLDGLMLYDDLFPHVTGGFRGRTITVTSVHYRTLCWGGRGRCQEEHVPVARVVEELGGELLEVLVANLKGVEGLLGGGVIGPQDQPHSPFSALIEVVFFEWW
ncbi:hypothetical protein E2C01_062060 [Portunus trituberculatus]|uniref:Uncharacterized protein n=1 Tax=Portunus trituberculatus TaxID=210409 RepID=A0A5B7HH00_PORTR|nr:hypothetical protein [Portunus trituberculatus]